MKDLLHQLQRQALMLQRVVAAVCLLALSRCAMADIPEWNIMFYLDGDNDLELCALADLLEMEQALPPNVEIIALVDRHREETKVLGNWSGTRLYRVRRGNYPNIEEIRLLKRTQYPQNLSSELLEDWGECDMSDPATLVRFINAAARFPAKRYALIPWDHGAGWISMLADHDGGSGKPGKESMTSDEFAAAALRGAQALPRKRFDLVVFDMCLMAQLDVLSTAASYADFAIACPPVQPGEGTDYLAVLPIYSQGLSTRDTVNAIVKANVDFFSRIGRAAAYTAFDLSAAPFVSANLTRLTEALKKLTPHSGAELSRALWYAAKLTSQDEALKNRDAPSYSSVSFTDWLERIEKTVPGVPADIVSDLKDNLRSLIVSTAATPGYDACAGVGIYMPLLPGNMMKNYWQTHFSAVSGIPLYLRSLYEFQKRFQSSPLEVPSVQLGRAVPDKDGRFGPAETVELRPRQTVVPFSRDAVKFEVEGAGIVTATLAEFEQHGSRKILHYNKLVADEDRRGEEGGNVNNLTAALSPHFREGKTTLLRGFVGVRFMVGSGGIYKPATVVSTTLSRELTENVSTGYGRYTDQSLGGRELDVTVRFSNVLHVPVSVEAEVRDSSGKLTGRRAVNLQQGGTFRPGLVVFDEKTGRQSLIYGEPVTIKDNLYLSMDLIPEGTKIGKIVTATNMGGRTASKISNLVTVKHDKAQMKMLRNGIQHVDQELPGNYAMVQMIRGADNEFMELPTYQSISIYVPQNGRTPRWHFSNGASTREGPLLWMDGGLPQLELHEDSARPQIAFGNTIESWYPFLNGSGKDRVWYCISDDGTRWALYPLEQYAGQLQGTFSSATETWQFSGSQVTYTRGGKTMTGTFSVKDNIFTATGLPHPRYTFHYNQRTGTLVIKAETPLTSILSRSGTGAAPASAPHNPVQTPQPSAAAQTEPAPQGTSGTGSPAAPQNPPPPPAAPAPEQTPAASDPYPAPPADALLGHWISDEATGYAALSIARLNTPSTFALTLRSAGQGLTTCTFTISTQPGRLAAVFPNGERQDIGYRLQNGILTLHFKRMPPISFTRWH